MVMLRRLNRCMYMEVERSLEVKRATKRDLGGGSG